MKGSIALVIVFVMLLAGTASAAESLDSLTTYGKIFGYYRYNISDYPEWYEKYQQNDYNEFDMICAMIGFKYKLSKSWLTDVLVDFPKSSVTQTKIDWNDANEDEVIDPGEWAFSDTTKQGRMAALRKAYIQYRPLKSIGARIGLIYNPHTYYCRFYKYRWVKASPLHQSLASHGLGVGSVSDFGMSIFGDLVFDGKTNWGGYELAVLNGEGRMKVEMDSGKAVEFAAWINTLALVDKHDLRLAGGYRYNKTQPDTIPSMGLFDTTVTSANAELFYDYQHSENFALTVGLGGFMRNETVALDGADDLNSTVYWGFLDVMYYKSLGLFARYDMSDPDTRNDEDAGEGWHDESWELIAGPWYSPIEPVKFMLNYRQRGYTADVLDDQGEEVSKPDDKYIYLSTYVQF